MPAIGYGALPSLASLALWWPVRLPCSDGPKGSVAPDLEKLKTETRGPAQTLCTAAHSAKTSNPSQGEIVVFCTIGGRSARWAKEFQEARGC